MHIDFPKTTLQGFGRRHLLKVIYEMTKQWDGESSTALCAINQALSVLTDNFQIELSEVKDMRSLDPVQAQLERLLKVEVADPEFMVTTKDKLHSALPSIPVTLVLENIRSSFNVGSCLRSAEANHIAEVIMTGYTPTPEHAKTAKSALGTQDWVKWSDYSSTAEMLGERNLPVYAIETSANSKSLHEVNFEFPCAIVMGNERFGLSEQTMKVAKQVVHVPLYGRKNSLNVGVCAGVVLYELRRQWNQ